MTTQQLCTSLWSFFVTDLNKSNWWRSQSDSCGAAHKGWPAKCRHCNIHLHLCTPTSYVFWPFITGHPEMRWPTVGLIRPACVSYGLDADGPEGHLGAQIGFFLLIHSQWFLDLAALVRYLIAFLWSCPLISMSMSSFAVELATKPLQPISTRQICTHSLVLVARSANHSVCVWKFLPLLPRKGQQAPLWRHPAIN